MGRTGDGWFDRRSAVIVAAVIALSVLPFLVGAAAPAALRAVLPTPTLPAVEAMGSAERDSQPALLGPAYADSSFRVDPEGLTEPQPPLRPGTVSQEATISEAPTVEAPAEGRIGAERVLPAPILKPSDPGWVARRLEIPALGVNVAVAWASGPADEDFPPHAGAYILRSSAQPGRGTNSYLFAHAMPNLFKPLWWAQPGQQVIVTMSDGQQLGYRITGIVRDIPCPDPTVHKPAGLPPVLANATECDLSWTYPTPTERLTMQTSQGFNRNYGEMVVLAEPDW